MKKIISASIVSASILLSFSSVLAVTPEMTNGFVCPVIKTENVLNSPRGGTLGNTGHYTIGGPDVMVPVHATNGDGEGVPEGPHSAPGNTDYTAIWAVQEVSE